MQHFLGIPFFAFISRDLWNQLLTVASLEPLDIRASFPSLLTAITPSFVWSMVGSVPPVWIYMAVNAMTQFVCIANVHQLTSFASSLTVNLILTFRKFISLMISVFFFQNRFESGHLTGTCLVFVGTLLYSLTMVKRRNVKVKPPARPLSALTNKND